jgi:hypothetical protein
MLMGVSTSTTVVILWSLSFVFAFLSVLLYYANESLGVWIISWSTFLFFGLFSFFLRKYP